MIDRRLTWVPHDDPSDAAYPVAELLKGRKATAAPAKLWGAGLVLDQGADAECVGHAWAGLIAAAPRPHSIGAQVTENPTAEHLYELAQQFDGVKPDEHTGASTLGGAKAARSIGAVTSFSWCASADEVAATVLHLGPVVVGTPWLRDMFTPDLRNRLRVSGAVAGGHEYLLRGYAPSTRLFRIRNSWGTGWGLGGDAYLSLDDLAHLLQLGGDACHPTKA